MKIIYALFTCLALSCDSAVEQAHFMTERDPRLFGLDKDAWRKAGGK